MKFLVASTLFVGSEQLVSEPSGWIGTIILCGAVVIALTTIWAKAVRPCVRFTKKFIVAVERLQEIPDRLDGVEARLHALDGKGKTVTTPDLKTGGLE
jgi:hypothetical protein